MKIHIISDTHFNHKNVAKYCNRPDDWVEKLMGNIVTLETDILIHLGDVSLGKDNGWHNFMNAYDKHKRWLILGNHDGKSMTWYMEHGWDFIARNFTMYLYGIRILFSHRPYPFPPIKTVTRELARNEAHSEVMVDKPRSNFDINVCGHVHNRKGTPLPEWCRPFILEEQDYKPIELQEFLYEDIRKRSLQQNEERKLLGMESYGKI